MTIPVDLDELADRRTWNAAERAEVLEEIRRLRQKVVGLRQRLRRRAEAAIEQADER